MAWRRRASGTSPTTAIVAAWRKSAISEPDDRRADDDAAVLVDQEAGRPGRAAAVERAARVAGRLDVDRRAASAPPPPPTSCVWPTDATCGSVKITRGEPGRRRRASQRRVLAEHVVARDRRLVLRHVGERRAAVEVADHVEPVVAGDAAVRVDLDVAVGLEADRSPARGPRPAGARPTATSSSSAVTSLPSSSVTVTVPPVARDRARLLAGADVDALLAPATR